MNRIICDLIDVTTYIPGTGEVVLRYGTHGYITSPTDTPPNTLYFPRVANAGNYKVTLYEPGTTGGASQVGYGEVVLMNNDGGLDALLDYGFDGRPIVIREGYVDGAYTDFVIVFTGTTEQAVVYNNTQLVLRLRDRQAELAKPLQTARYGGSNVLPAGIDGGPEIKGVLKPWIAGNTPNAPTVCINTSRHIYQVHDGVMQTPTAVYDSGVPLRKQSSDFANSVIDNIAISGLSRGFVKSLGSSYPATFATITQTGVMEFISESTRAIIRTVNLTITNTGQDIPMSAISATVFAVGVRKAATPHKIALVDSTTGSVTEITIPNSRIPNGLQYSSNTNKLLVVASSAFGGTATDDVTIYSMDCSNNIFSAALATLPAQSAVYNKGLLYVREREEIYIGYTSNSTSVLVNICVFSLDSGTIIRTVPVSNTETFYTPSRDSATGRTYFATSVNSVLVLDDGASEINRALTISFSFPVWYLYLNANERLLFTADSTGGLYPMDVPQKTILGRAGLTSAAVNLLANDSTSSTLIFCAMNNSPNYLIQTVRMVSTPLADYANQTEMEAATGSPLPGFYRACPSMGMIRAGSKPVGVLTCDAVQGATAANRTTAQVMKAILLQAGLSSGDIIAPDITALDTANSAEIGLCAGESNADALLDMAARSIGAWWTFDALGKFRCGRLTTPSGTPVVSLTSTNITSISKLASNDPGRGVPNWKVVVKYAKNWQVQTGGVAGYVSAERAAYLKEEYRSVSASDASVQTLHLLSPEMDVLTLLATEAAGSTEAARLLALYSVRCDRLEVGVPYNVARLSLMDVVEIIMPRFGYTAGKLFLVIGVSHDFAAQKQVVTLWG